MKAADKRYIKLFSEAGSSLQDIGKLYLVPFLNHKPKTAGLQGWLEQMFHTNERQILRYIAEKPFLMPGLQKITAEYMVAGTGYRKIKQGIQLWVRTDSTRPDVVEIECDIGKGAAMHWFHLTKSEWDKGVLPNVKQDRRVK